MELNEAAVKALKLQKMLTEFAEKKPSKKRLNTIVAELNRIHGSKEAFDEIQEGFDTLDEIAKGN